MIYRRKTYQINPERLEVFNEFFHTYLYPNQRKYGAKLVGRWTNETQNEITAIWEYSSTEQYESIERKIRASKLHQKAHAKRKELGDLFIDSKQEFLTSTAPKPFTSYHPPKHIVSVSGFITNENGEVLLVRNLHRSDTMEMLGGQVEEGESLEQAIHREIMEETGVKVNLIGVTGIYQNLSSGVLCIVFRGTYKSGSLTPREGETTEVVFKTVTKENAKKFMTRPHMLSRVIDAMEPNYLPYEAYHVRPYELISRFEVKKEYE